MSSSVGEWLAARSMTVFAARLANKLGISLCWINTRDVTSNDTASPSPHNGLRIAQASLTECQVAAANPALDMPIEFVLSAFGKGDICHAVWDGRRWLLTLGERNAGRHTLMLFVFTSHPNTAMATKPSRYRPIGALACIPAIAATEAQTMLAFGLPLGISFTHCTNAASIRADRKFGNRIVGLAGYCLWRSWGFSFATPEVKALGFAFVRQR